jgi:uncharacterized membrane protein
MPATKARRLEGNGRTVARRSLITAELAWAASLIAATYAAAHAPSGTFAHGAAAFEYAAASLLCHQRPERSFFLWGVQLPVCARCAGIYAGAACAAVAGAGRRLARPAAVLAAAAAPGALSLVYEWTTGIMPSNAIRAITGAIAGYAVMAVLAGELRGE